MATVYPPVTTSGVVTSWVPLTTTFTPSIGCESKFRLNGWSLVAYDPGYGLDIDSKVRCAPAAVTTWWEQGRLGRGNAEGHTAVSIGPLICPNAWSTVVSSVRGSSTHAMCCYTLDNGIPGTIRGDCLSDISSGAVLTFASTRPNTPDSWSIATTTLSSDSSIGAIAVVGWNIALDVSALSATASTTASSAATSDSISLSSASSTPAVPVGPTAADPTASSNSDSADGGSSSGLPTGVAVGIGVGVGPGVAALIATMYLIRSRKRKAAAATAAAAAATTSSEAEEKSGHPPTPNSGEGYRSGPYELVSESARWELLGAARHQRQSHHRPYELP